MVGSDEWPRWDLRIKCQWTYALSSFECTFCLHFQVRIDHRPPKLFVFGSDVALAPYESDIGEITSDSQIPTDRVRSQLVMLLTSLTRTHRITKSQNDLVRFWQLFPD